MQVIVWWHGLLKFTQQLSAECWKPNRGGSAEASSYVYQKLWTASFRAAIKTGQFADALLNCMDRYTMAQDLVVSMLYQFCADRHFDGDFYRVTNMYGIAEVTIQELVADSGGFCMIHGRIGTRKT